MADTVLTDLLADPGPDIYYTKAFRDVLEDHLTWLRDYHSSIMIIQPDEAYQWRGDLFGLLAAKGVPRHLHWLIMRLNRWTSPTHTDENTLAVLKPNPTVVEQILQSYNSTARIS